MYNMIVLSYYYGIITPYSHYTSCTIDMPVGRIATADPITTAVNNAVGVSMYIILYVIQQ